MRPFLRFSAILVVFVTSELPAAAQGTVETKKTDFKAKCPPQVWIKLGSEERRETTPGGDSASLPNEIDRLVKESDALDGVQLFLWKSRLGRSIEAERELKQVDAQYLPADLRKVVEGLQACHELRAAFASRGRDVRGIERSLTKLGDATRDANLVESLRSCLIEGERGETADPSKVSARLEQVAANFRERVVEHWKVACRDFRGVRRSFAIVQPTRVESDSLIVRSRGRASGVASIWAMTRTTTIERSSSESRNGSGRRPSRTPRNPWSG